MGDPDHWTCTVICNNPVLSGEYIEKTSRAQYDQGASVYERKASNTKVPAEVTITWKSANPIVEVASKASIWKLYYKTEPPVDKTIVTFICGTKFELTDPDNPSGGSVRVSGCTIDASFNGDYTHISDDTDADGSVNRRYTRTIASGASTLNKIPSYVTCNWTKKSFGIEIMAHRLIVGQCTPNDTGQSRKTLSAVVKNGEAGNASIILTYSPNALCTYVPFGMPASSTSSGFIFSCYAGSMGSESGMATRSATCKAGRLGTFEPCKPGPTQKYIIVTKFELVAGSLVPFNGSYVYDESSGQPGKPVTWKNTKASASTWIVASDTASNILELRDTSSSVNYCIKITAGTPVSLSFYKTTPTSTSSPLTVTTDFKAEFSAKPAVPDPCEAWSTCIGTNSDKPSQCATEASSCSNASTASKTSTLSLNIGSPPVVVAMSPLVANAPHLYGTTADALFVFVPLADNNKAKVLSIPNDTTTASAVKDAVLSTKGWTVASFVTATNPTPPTPPTPPATEPTGKETCEDLVSCATTATTLSFSSCAAKAVACDTKRPKDLVQTDSLTHGDEKGIKLYQLTSDVLYGTDAVNAYVVLVRKEKVLVAPRDNKTDATVLDVAKEGTVWTSKTGLSIMVWIGIGLGIFGFIVVVVLLFFAARRSDDESYQGYTKLRHADRGYDYDSSYAVPRPRPRIRQSLQDINPGVPTTTTATTNTTAQGPTAL